MTAIYNAKDNDLVLKFSFPSSEPYSYECVKNYLYCLVSKHKTIQLWLSLKTVAYLELYCHNNKVLFQNFLNLVMNECFNPLVTVKYWDKFSEIDSGTFSLYTCSIE